MPRLTLEINTDLYRMLLVAALALTLENSRREIGRAHV